MIPVVFTLLLVLGTTFAQAQQKLPSKASPTVRELNEQVMQGVIQGDAVLQREDYIIGSEDLLDISVFEVPELSRTVRVSAAGEVSLPLIGSVKAAGLSPLQLERVLTELLRRTYLKEPQVTVFLKEFHSDPVSVMGAVKMPGLYHIQTRKSLVEVLAMAQGLSEGPVRQPGRTIVITRKPRPPTASDATKGGPSTTESNPGKAEILEVPIKELLQSGDPKWNIAIYPGDVVKVLPAGTVYVAGDVNKPGSFPLTDFENMSAIKALALAGGTKRSASRKNALIIRTDENGNRIEQKLDLGRVLKGKDADTTLGPNDILFVPGSVGKESALRAIEMGIQTATGILIWRR